jgi:FAD/FMN-containing dehydrogenase
LTDVRAALERLLGPAGVLPGEPVVACPANEDQVVETIRLAAKERRKIAPVGLASSLPQGTDFLLSTRRLKGVVAYEPGDGTLSARAGTTMADLERVTRASGNHLTPRVAAADRSTLGGVLAGGRSGIDRLRYGPSRHHVLGMRVALSDGSVAQCGGRLVKNVTGYDLHRLYCGSRGSLCVVLEASMRLFAGFEREVLLTAPARDRAHAIDSARSAEALGVRPLAIRAENVLDPRGAWRVHVLLAGRPELVDWGRRTLLASWPGAAEGSETSDRLRDAELAPGRWPDLRATARRSQLAAGLARLSESARLIVEPAIGLAWVFVEADAVEKTANTLREAGLADRGSAGAALSARLKRAFDPDGILAGT